MAEPMDRSARRVRTERLVLAALQDAGALSREQLGQATGLSRSAVSAVVRHLLADGAVAEHSAGRPEGRGRPRTRLTIARTSGPVVGVDFGHAHVAVAVADSTGDVIAERAEDLDVDSHPTVALEVASGAVRACVHQVGLDLADVAAVAACIPGPLERGTSSVRSASVLATWAGLNPPAELESRLHVPVQVGNDADLGALGEFRFGAGRHFSDLIYVKASHGIGAGLILDGRTYRGSVGIAGEIGHTQLVGETRLCRCGSRGCLETVIGVDEIRRQLEHVLGRTVLENDMAHLDAEPTVQRILAEAGRTLGRVLADLCNCLNPAAIIVGGELGEVARVHDSESPLLVGVRESIDRYAQPAAAAAVTVHQAALGPRAELIGAIATAMGVAGDRTGELRAVR